MGINTIEKHRTLSVVETLLLVDGDPDSRRALKFLMEVNGYRVVEAKDGREGLWLLENRGEHIHLALCCAHLKDMTGQYWLRLVEALLPGLPTLLLFEEERVESMLAPVGPWYGGLPARPPYPGKIMEAVRAALDEYFFGRMRVSAA